MAGYTSGELRELDGASSVAISGKKDMAQLIQHVNNMGGFSRFWDSKVPDSKRSFFRWFSLKVSDPEALKREIAKHGTFYADMEKAFSKVRSGDEDADEDLQDLYQKLLEIYEEDESQIRQDDSKILYRLHKGFVVDRHRLESCIKRVECVNVRRQLKKTKDDWQNTLDALKNLTEQMQRARNDNRYLTERFERLMTVNEQLVSQQEQIGQENLLIRTLLQQLISGLAA